MTDRRKETKQFNINQRCNAVKQIINKSVRETVFNRVIKNAKAIKLDK